MSALMSGLSGRADNGADGFVIYYRSPGRQVPIGLKRMK